MWYVLQYMMQVYTFHSTESASLIQFLHPYHTEVTIALAHNQLKQISLRVLEINTSSQNEQNKHYYERIKQYP